MKDRRLKIGLVSMHIVASWGKDIAIKVKEAIPDSSIILKNEEDFKTASMGFLIHDESFENVPDGEACPKVLLDIPLNDKQPKPRLIYNH